MNERQAHAELDAAAAQSIRYAVPLVRSSNRWWPEPKQFGLCGFLVFVIVGEVLLLWWGLRR